MLIFIIIIPCLF